LTAAFLKQCIYMLPKVAIIWLCYGNLKHLPAVAASWAALTYPRDLLTIYILPAQSPDGIAAVVARDILPQSGITLPKIVIINAPNCGFSVNNNVGIAAALADGADFVYLQNGDLRLSPSTITEVVSLANTSPIIGSVQSLVCYWHDEGKVNTSGGAVHPAGYAFARDNCRQLSALTLTRGEEIVYSSGAAVLYSAVALKKVGLLEEGFFMYQEDVELGLRLRIAGYKNVLASSSLVYHDYIFSGRQVKKFAWMELYRWLVILAYYRLPTIILLSPFLLAVELGSWLLAARGAGLAGKWYSYCELAKPRTWKLWWYLRRRAQRLRTIPDKQYLRLFTGKIEAQEISSPLVDKIINPTVDAIWRALRFFIIW
jgi:GT2 family glycosyltransferase